jgi:hypothetical protein
MAFSAVVIAALPRKPPAAICDRPRPVLLKVTLVIVSLLVPVSLKLTVRLLPLSRLTPL